MLLERRCIHKRIGVEEWACKMIQERYDIPTAAAWILSRVRRTVAFELPETFRWKEFSEKGQAGADIRCGRLHTAAF